MGKLLPEGKNSFDRFELAGAFGDLGTMIPFLAAYFAVLHVPPAGVLFVFGVSNIMVGMLYKTPVPVQPMKAIGAAAIAAPGSFGVPELFGASIFTAFFWMITGALGIIEWLKKIAEKPVVRGIIFGLGMTFITMGIKMMLSVWWLGVIGLILTFIMLQHRTIPAMFVLLSVGFLFTLVFDQQFAKDFFALRPHFQLPQIMPGELNPGSMLSGVIFLALPQIPLTLGNGIIALETENNKLFPARATSVKKISLTTAGMNFLAAFFGGVPMCHGAGGMAGHVRFGAHTGGATIVLGIVLLSISLFFSDSVSVLFAMFPTAILGVILLYAGVELCFGARDVGSEAYDFYIFVVVAGFSLWNIGAAFFIGIVLGYLKRHDLLRI